MLFIDGIVYTLQKRGGISTYFDNILLNLDFKCCIGLYRKNFISFKPDSVSYYNNSFFKEFDSVPVNNNFKIFHSSYYRCPDKNFKNFNIVTVHDFIHEKISKSIFSYKHILLKKQAIKSANHIICVSKNTKNDLLNFFPNLMEKDISVIYHGVSNKFFKIKEDDFSYKPYVIFVGNRTKYKNFELALQTLSLLPKNISIYIVGTSPLNFYELMLIKRYKIENRYQFIFNLDLKTLNEYYNNAIALLYPSEYEGFGFPVIEAMKSGCPVIILRKSTVTELVNGSKVILKEKDAYDIYLSILDLLNLNYRKPIILSNLNYSLRYSWESSIANHLSLYKSFS
jgi:mannosyltransferase